MKEFYNELERLANEYNYLLVDGARFLIDEYAEQCDGDERKIYELLSDVIYALANGDDVQMALYRFHDYITKINTL